MKEIAPSQFIEAILESQRNYMAPSLALEVRTFNSLVDQLAALNICTRFGFLDLIDFAEHFGDTLPYKEFTIQIAYSDSLFNEVKRYNKIYTSIDNFAKIHEVWNGILK